MRLALFTGVMVIAVLAILVRDAMKQENRQAVKAVDRIALVQASSADLILAFDTSINARTTAHVDELVENLDRALTELETPTGTTVDLDPLIRSAKSFRLDIDAGLRLTSARQWDAAEFWRQGTIDLRYRSLMQSANAARTALIANTEGNGRIGDLGSVVAIALIAIAVGSLITQLQRYSVRDLREAVERESLASSEARFRGLVQYASDIVAILDEQKRFTYLSASFERLLKHDSNQWLNRKATDIIHPDDHRGASRFFRDIQVAEPGTACVMIMRIMAPDGSWRWFEVTGSDHVDDPAIGGTVINAREITDRRLAEAEVERFRVLIERNPAISFINSHDPSGAWAFEYVSPQVRELLGIEPAAWIADREAYYDAIHPDDRERIRLSDRGQMRDTAAQPVQYRFVRTDGRIVWVSEEVWYIEAAGGEPAIWQGRIVDITAEREALQAVRAAEDRFRSLVEQMPAIAFSATIDDTLSDGWRFTYISPRMHDVLGYDPEQWMLERRVFSDIIVPEDRVSAMATVHASADANRPIDTRFRVTSANGSICWLHVVCHDIGGGIWHGMLTDETASREIEGAAREAELRFRTLVEQLPAGTYVASLDTSTPGNWKYRYRSPRFLDLIEVTEDSGPMTGPEWRDMIHPSDVDGYVEKERSPQEPSDSFDHEFRIMLESGRQLWVREIARAFSFSDSGEQLWLGVLIDVSDQREAQDALRLAEHRFRSLIESLPAIVYTERLSHDKHDWRHHYISPQIESLIGYTPEEWVSDPNLWSASIHPDDRERAVDHDQQTEHTGDSFELDYRLITRSGDEIWVHDEAIVIHDEHGNPLYWQGILFDISAQKTAEEELRQREEEFRLLFSRNPQPTWVYDEESLAFLEVNDAACASYGYTRDEFLLMRVADLTLARSDHEARSRVLPDGTRETRHIVHGGRVIDVEITSHRLMFRGRAAWLEIAQDVTTRNELQAQLSHQAFHDALTGLPNRSLFTNRLEGALGVSRSLAVLFIDLDNFKVINDTLGHDAGDALLLSIGQRLAHSVRPTDTVARLGGDEFTILLDGASLDDAIRTADRLIERLAEPIHIDGHDVTVTPSIGIAITDPLAGSSDELLRRADVAMYKAKGHGKGRFVIFDSSMDDDAWKRLSFEGELRRAISAGQLSVFYQPIIDLSSGAICELEALVRWRHPEHGLVSPLDFIPLAEETGLIIQIGAWVLEEACAQVRDWQLHRGWGADLRIAVNLSVRQFVQTDLVECVERALTATCLPPDCLRLEITESVAIHDIPATMVTLQRLKSIGVKLAIDDFGTGYSGLSYLQSCPVDSLKIDRSYVDSIGHNVGDRAMIQAVMAFARTLGLSVTAEGVETTDQLSNLRRLGVDHAQGYYFSPPLPAEAMAEFLESNRSFVALASAAD